MKTNRYIFTALLLPALLLAGSCSRESLPGAESDPVLLISPVAKDGQESILRTRALSEDDLKDDNYQENVINRLDVFFFNGDALAKAYHKDKESLTPETHAGITGYPLSKDFTQDGLQKGVPYTVYVIANAASDAIKTGTGISAPADLEALTLEDANIYKRQKNDTEDITYTKEKSFLMNAKINWTIPTVATQLVGDATINLTRTAVKFVIDISLSDEFKDRLAEAGLQYGAPSWKYQHFNIQSYEVLGSQTEAVKELVDSPSGGWAYLAAEALEDDTYQIVTYAYPQAWTDGTAMDEVPAILLSFASGNYHYYYIPLCQSSLGSTANNHLYRVKAVINSYGSSEAVTSNDVDLTYEVMGWDEGTDKIATVNAQLTEYLMVTPTTYVFKGGSTSSALTTQIKYYASDKVTLSGLTGFYIDKNGDKVPVNSGNSTYTVSSPSTTETSGALDINSIVPTNGTYREFQFTLTCGTKSQVVKVRHYPLDFITAEDGAYSTYNFSGWVKLGTSGDYNGSLVGTTRNGTNYFTFVADDNSTLFNAHTFYNSQVYILDSDGTRGSSAGSHLTNNRMYVLQITSSNDKYTIGRPSLLSQNADVYSRSGAGGPGNNYTYTDIGDIQYSTSKDNVISPAFMLGSQLGAVSVFSDPTYAAMHCALYKEVSGGKEFTGWRLPTKQEVQYMIDNQNKYGDTMAEVVGGRYYWTLDGGYAYNKDANGSQDGSSLEGAKYVRCVRDLTAEELAEINKFE